MHRIHKEAQRLRKKQDSSENNVPNISRTEFDQFYDPPELFSRNRAQNYRALLALCKDWAQGHSNNLYLWRNGERMTLGNVFNNL